MWKSAEKIGYADITIAGLVESGGKTTRQITVDVSNSGHDAAYGVTVELRNESMFGEIIATGQMDRIEPGQTTAIKVDFSDDGTLYDGDSNQKLLYVYVATTDDEADYSNNSGTIVLTASNSGAGVSVTGKVTSYSPGTATTLKLMQGDTAALTTTIAPAAGTDQVEQLFTFEGVAPGTYTLVVTKPGHTKYTVQNIVVSDADVDLTQDPRPGAKLITLLCGDINGDGSINDADLTILWRAANYNKNVSVADNQLCDLDGSGAVNDGDLTILWRPANYNRGAVTISG